MVQIVEVGSQAFNEILESVRREARITTEKELRQKDRWLTTEEACHLMSVSPKTLGRKRDELNSVLKTNDGTGKALRYLESSVNKYLEGKKR